MEIVLTIITPTFNRAYTLKKCLDSLKRQQVFTFEWLIVDDGSTDNTEVIVNEWIKETKQFYIRYVKKENGGKASALNAAFTILRTPYACVLDSDDYLYDNAIDSFLKERVRSDKDDLCCGVMGLRHDEKGNIKGGEEIPTDSGRITMVDILNKGIRTELFCFYKTSIISKMQFPLFPNEKFVSPQWLDFELARNYYFIPSADRYCVCSYIADGLTRNKKKIVIKNPHGYTAVKRQSFEFSDSLALSIKHGIMYDCGCIIGKDHDWLSKSPKKLLTVILMPIAYMVYLFRYANRGKKVK